MRHLRGLAILLCLSAAGAHAAAARVLEVGKDREFPSLTAAAAAAENGDTVNIADGEYFDCAIWRQNNLTVQGASESGTVITDKACQGKALFVIPGNNVTIRNLTLTRARVPDGNGAGIRAEGRDLTIDHVRFINNQDGILTTDQPQSTIIIRNSEFTRNGSCEGACAHGIYISHIALLRVEHSIFSNTREAHHIKSRAARTEIVDNDISDGPTGTASYEIDVPNGGSLLVSGNRMEKGPNAQNHTAFIMIGEEGITQPTREIIVENNQAVNDGDYKTVLVNNGTATEAVVRGNKLTGAIKALHGDGSVS